MNDTQKLRRAVFLAMQAEIESARYGDRIEKHAAEMRARSISDYLRYPQKTPEHLRKRIMEFVERV